VKPSTAATAAKTAGPKSVDVKAAAAESAAMESTAAEAAPMKPTAAAETAAVTTTASTAVTTTAPAAPRQGGVWLGGCQNARERGNGNSQAARNADRLHANLLLTIAARLAADEW
jgi:hypothetical protein